MFIFSFLLTVCNNISFCVYFPTNSLQQNADSADLITMCKQSTTTWWSESTGFWISKWFWSLIANSPQPSADDAKMWYLKYHFADFQYTSNLKIYFWVFEVYFEGQEIIKVIAGITLIETWEFSMICHYKVL